VTLWLSPADPSNDQELPQGFLHPFPVPSATITDQYTFNICVVQKFSCKYTMASTIKLIADNLEDVIFRKDNLEDATTSEMSSLIYSRYSFYTSFYRRKVITTICL
jgi:hypothetical protein